MAAQEKEYHGHPMFYAILEELRDLHSAKNRMYATKEKPLGNFERGGRLISKMLKPGLNVPLAHCLALMSKQVDGVYEMFGESKTDCPEGLEDKLRDVAVYSVIAMVILRESRGPKPGSVVYGKEP